MVGDLARDTTDGIEVLEDEQPVGSLDQVPDGAQAITLEEVELTTTTVTSGSDDNTNRLALVFPNPAVRP